MLIQAFDLQSLLEKSEPVILLDVRQPQEYEVFHLADAWLIPLDQLHAQLQENNHPLWKAKDSHIVVYCAHGIRSIEGARILMSLGFTQVQSLQGGLARWNQLLPKS